MTPNLSAVYMHYFGKERLGLVLTCSWKQISHAGLCSSWRKCCPTSKCWTHDCHKPRTGYV